MKNYKTENIKIHFGITHEQFLNIYQQMDTGCPYYNFDEMYKKYNKEPGTYSKIKISKTKYKNTILLLLSYQKNIIVF